MRHRGLTFIDCRKRFPKQATVSRLLTDSMWPSWVTIRQLPKSASRQRDSASGTFVPLGLSGHLSTLAAIGVLALPPTQTDTISRRPNSARTDTFSFMRSPLVKYGGGFLIIF